MMKNLLRLEEGAQFLACLAVLILGDVAWWVYLLLALGPDIGIAGYLVNSRVGAFTYNLFHHKGIALLVLLIGVSMGWTIYPPLSALPTGSTWIISGIILFGHASMDRMLGYGLKYGDDFKHTHLGWIGKARTQGQEQ